MTSLQRKLKQAIRRTQMWAAGAYVLFPEPPPRDNEYVAHYAKSGAEKANRALAQEARDLIGVGMFYYEVAILLNISQRQLYYVLRRYPQVMQSNDLQS